MNVILRIVDGVCEGHNRMLRSRGDLTVGRTERAVWVIPHDPELSGLHFRLDFDGQAAQVEDLGSTNGTFVNEQRVSRQPLSDGDTIRAGRTRFRVVLEVPRHVRDSVADDGVRGTMPADRPAEAAERFAMPRSDRFEEPAAGEAASLTPPPQPADQPDQQPPYPASPASPLPSQPPPQDPPSPPRDVAASERSLPGGHGDTVPPYHQVAGAAADSHDAPQSAEPHPPATRGEKPPADTPQPGDVGAQASAETRVDGTAGDVSQQCVVIDVRGAGQTGRCFHLGLGGVVMAGCSPQADWVFPMESGLSGKHFALDYSEHGLFVAQLPEGGTTLLEGAPVSLAQVHPGNTIRAGELEFVLRAGDSAAAGPAPTDAQGAPRGAPPSRPASSGPPSGPVPRENAAHPRARGAVPPRAAAIIGPQHSGRLTESAVPIIEKTTPVGGGFSREERHALFRLGILDDDPAVQREVLHAAAWTRQPWLLGACREVCLHPCASRYEWYYLFACVAPPDDAECILRLGTATQLGAQRFRIWGVFGHPAVVPALLAAMRDPDAATAASAAQAFHKITGVTVDSQVRVAVAPAGGVAADEFEQEFAGEVHLPDPDLAAQIWDQVQDDFQQGTRWCRGHDLSGAVSSATVAALDLESRYELFLRAKFYGVWQGSPVELDRLTRPYPCALS